MYRLAGFGKMIADRGRLDAHAAALRRLVTPSSVVLDLGAGTGIMSLLACQAGARRVYAVEPSGAVQILAEAAAANGYADRVVVLERRSTDTTLPELADVIVSDLRGVLPPNDTHFSDIIDARARLLAPGGRLVPARDTLWAAVVSTPEAFDERRAVWQSRPHGLDLSSAQRFVDNGIQKHDARPEHLVSAPVQWASLDYPTLADTALRGAGACEIARAGTAHGLLVWFDTALVDDIGYSNAPGAREGMIYGQMLFGWPAPIALEAGDRVAFELRADPVGSDYVWTWTSEIEGQGRVSRFRQTTFEDFPRSAASLRRRLPGAAPALSAAGAEALEVLEGMRAGRTTGEIAARLFAAHPQRFRTVDEAHGRVAELVDRFGE
jgi:protein arginine N-methyltransferase 1